MTAVIKKGITSLRPSCASSDGVRSRAVPASQTRCPHPAHAALETHAWTLASVFLPTLPF